MGGAPDVEEIFLLGNPTRLTLHSLPYFTMTIRGKTSRGKFVPGQPPGDTKKLSPEQPSDGNNKFGPGQPPVTRKERETTTPYSKYIQKENAFSQFQATFLKQQKYLNL